MNTLLLLFAATSLWSVRIEEPTGLYRRTGEIAAVPLSKLNNHTAGFTVTDAAGRELPHQVSSGALRFPIDVLPGQLPVYTVACCDATPRAPFTNPITARRLGLARVEFGNAHFRAVVDLPTAAIVELYPLRAAPHHTLNLVETTPESRDALKGDIHEETVDAAKVIPPAVAGVDGENTGWTTLGASGPITKVDIAEAGPLRGRILLTRGAETWDITWDAAAPAFRWKALAGFRFAAISASPYLPFNRVLHGSEYDFPTGPGEPEPEPNRIGPRPWPKLPGHHIVYYQREADYGALGIVALDAALTWRGAGTRRIEARKPAGPTEIAITFPQWAGAETYHQARREARTLLQPVLVSVSAAQPGQARITAPAPRVQPPTLTAAAPAPFTPTSLPLDGAWELAWAEKGQGPPTTGWRTVQVPGTAHVQWLNPEQLYSRDAEWISAKEWWYRRKFTPPASFAGRTFRLQFDATDYYADTYLNGRHIGRHEGYIDPYEYDVTPHLKPGVESELMVRVWTPVGYYWKHRPYTVKGAYGAVDQKPDDITPLGITRSVRLTASLPAFIKDVAVATRLTASAAEVEVALEASRPGQHWQLTLEPRNFQSTQRIQLTTSNARAVIPVPNPQLWWTWDHGKPNLYTLTVRLLDESGAAIDGRSLAVGIREIEKIGWHFYLNRKRLFIRGTNYYFHLFMSEMTRAKYQRDVDLMLAMNVNMIRVHCHFSNPEFYDLADERGVLVWQDFLEAWYPHDTGFSLHAAPLYDNHIRYARNHPSIALWASSDEEDFENYTDITKHLAPRASLLDPQRRPVIRSTGRFGDSHVYHGWYNGSIWDYTQMTENFVSELGATSLPNYETLNRFMGAKWPIRDHLDDWIWRRLQIKEAFRAWGDPGTMSMQDYIPRTQSYTARLFQIALERTRQRKAEGAGGILHFHAIDIWPSVTMAAIDFERRPTKVYDVVRRSFAPVAALFQYDRDKWKPAQPFTCTLWAVNDRWQPVSGSLRWKIVNASNTTLAQGAWPISLQPDSSLKLGEARWTPSAPGAYQLVAEIAGPDGKAVSENIYEFEVISQ